MTKPKKLTAALILALLSLPLVSCDDSTQPTDLPSPSPSPVATSSPSPTPAPTPTPDPCDTADVVVQAKLGGSPIVAWVPGEVPTLYADPTDNMGQYQSLECPGVQVVGWAQPIGTAICIYQGPQARRTNRYVCDTVGETEVGATINQSKGTARFSVIAGSLAAQLEAQGVDWRHLRPFQLKAAIRGIR